MLLNRPSIVVLSSAIILLVGCGEKKRVATRVPPPPPPVTSETTATRPTPDPDPDVALNPDVYARRTPIFVETGMASWYGPPYHNRKAATGEIYDMHQLTAAHKTLPLNSIVRVTNVANGKAVIVRINDRGPFIGSRIIDLSYAAAHEIETWRAGVAKVRVEVLETPKPLDQGGRWCVQIGAFSDAEEATRLKEKLARKYRTANVIQFKGPTGAWVRFRPMNDEKARAVEVANSTNVSEGGVFLVRLD
jgi:rare lipoprotein A